MIYLYDYISFHIFYDNYKTYFTLFFSNKNTRFVINSIKLLYTRSISHNIHNTNYNYYFFYSLGPFEFPAASEMVSRRRILSRSRDDLTQSFNQNMEDEEDVWYHKDKLYKVCLTPFLKLSHGRQYIYKSTVSFITTSGMM